MKHKKFLIFAALFLTLLGLPLTALAADANPFSDIPKGHWAYDAAAMLASQGVMTGYDAAKFGGNRLVTRYEMASALGRALAKFDAEHATLEQLELVQRMTDELHDELDALGVKLDKIDGRVSALEDRLGGWSLSGSLQMNADFRLHTANGESRREFRLSRARLNLMRRSRNGDFVYAQMDSRRRDTTSVTGVRSNEYSPYFSKVYANFGIMNGWRMTVGLFSVDYETYNMTYSTGRFGEYGQGAWFTDMSRDGFAFSKSTKFGFLGLNVYKNNPRGAASDDSMGVTGLASIQLSEKLVLDIGADYQDVDNPNTTLDEVTTIWFAPKYELTQNIGVRGAYYAQFTDYTSAETYNPDTRPSAWRVIIDIKQPLLKFTSLWLEYDRFDRNFVMLSGAESLLLSDRDNREFFYSSNLGGDLEIFRIGMNQIWNDKLSSWLYYAKYKFSGYPVLTNIAPLYVDYISPEMDEISAGVEYRYSKNVAFSLAYFYHKFNKDANMEKDRVIRFRTTVRF